MTTIIHNTITGITTEQWDAIRTRIFHSVGKHIEDTRRAQKGIRIALYVTVLAFCLFIYISAMLAM